MIFDFITKYHFLLFFTGNFVVHNKSYKTKIDYDGNSKCNIKLKEKSSSTSLGEAHIDCTWNIEKFTNTLNLMKEKKKLTLDSKVEDSLTLNTKEPQNSSGFDCKPFITTFKGLYSIQYCLFLSLRLTCD